MRSGVQSIFFYLMNLCTNYRFTIACKVKVKSVIIIIVIQHDSFFLLISLQK